MWHSDIQSRILKYRSSSKCKHFRKFTFPNPPEYVVDPCVNRFIELLCESDDKTRVVFEINKTIEELNAFLKYIEQISTSGPETRTASLVEIVGEEMEEDSSDDT